MKEPTEAFYRAFTFSGTCRTTCRCGVTHFTSDGGFDFDEGELEELELLAERDPEHYRDWGRVTVEYVTFGGSSFVFECACKGLRPYEDFIWAWRDNIVAYLSNMAVERITAAGHDAVLAARGEALVDMVRDYE